MSKFKQNLYSVLLIGSCLVASPFMLHKIWASSEDAKKNVEIPPAPPVVELPQPTDAPTEPVPTEAPQPTEAAAGDVTEPPTAATEPPTEAPEAVPTGYSGFVSNDLSYFDDALFIGDSRTVGIREYGTFTKSDFFCDVGLAASNIKGEYVDGSTFEQKINGKQYGKVYIMLGINEVGNDFEFTVGEYRKVVDSVLAAQPNAVVYIQGNLHVAYSGESTYINNEAINYLNSRLATLADNTRTFYIDINELYDDSNGYLTQEYTSDGIHPLARYYQQWCDWLCTKTVPTAPPPAPTDPPMQIPMTTEPITG